MARGPRDWDVRDKKLKPRMNAGNFLLRSELGEPNGVCDLDEDGLVPPSRLPPASIASPSITGIARAAGCRFVWTAVDRVTLVPSGLDGKACVPVVRPDDPDDFQVLEITDALEFILPRHLDGGSESGNTGYACFIEAQGDGTYRPRIKVSALTATPTAPFTHISAPLMFLSNSQGTGGVNLSRFVHSQNGVVRYDVIPNDLVEGVLVLGTTGSGFTGTSLTAVDLAKAVPYAANCWFEMQVRGANLNATLSTLAVYRSNNAADSNRAWFTNLSTSAAHRSGERVYMSSFLKATPATSLYARWSVNTGDQEAYIGVVAFNLGVTWGDSVVVSAVEGGGGSSEYEDPLTTKGDLVVRTATETTRLGVGTDGQVLTSDSGASAGVSWQAPGSGYTDEEAQDAVGGMLVDSSSVNFTYNDATPSITAVVLPAGVDHGALGGLGDDDHSQYALLAGRGSGQTLKGGTASAGNLTLDSTAHGTKGDVIIQPSGGSTTVGDTLQVAGVIIADGDIVGGTSASGDITIDSTSHGSKGNVFIQPGGGNVGIGDPIASRKLEVHEAADVSTLIRVENENTSNSALAGVEVVADSSIVTFKTHSSTSTATLLGASAAEKSAIVEADGTGLIVATAGANPIQLGTNNVERLSVSSAGVGVWNETGADADFRAEGDTDANLLFLDAGNDRVGVGTASPATKADINGAVRVASYIEQAEQSAPSTPGSGFGRFYTNTSGKPHFINDAGTDYDISGSAAAGGSVQLIGSHDTAGAAETTVQFSVSALAAGYHWELYCGIENPTGGAVDYWLEFGSGGTLDTTGTNYFAQPAQFNNGAAVGSNRSNSAIATPTSAGDRCTIEAKIMRDEEPRTRAHIFATREDPANIILRLTAFAWNSTTNPTEVGIVAQTASGIGIGSWFRLYLVLGA